MNSKQSILRQSVPKLAGKFETYLDFCLRLLTMHVFERFELFPACSMLSTGKYHWRGWANTSNKVRRQPRMLVQVKISFETPRICMLSTCLFRS